MWSEEEIEAPDLLHIEKDLTEIEFENIKNNSETILKEDKLEQIERPPLNTIQKEDRKTLVQNLKEQVTKAKTDLDIKNILNQILTTIE